MMRRKLLPAPVQRVLVLVVPGLLLLLTGCGLMPGAPADDIYLEELEALDLPRRVQELSAEADAIWEEVVADDAGLEFEDISTDVWQERREKSREWRDRYQEISAQAWALPVTDATALAHENLEEALPAMERQVELTGQFFDLALELKELDEEDLSEDDRERLESMLEELDDLERELEQTRQKHRQFLAAWMEAIELLP